MVDFFAWRFQIASPEESQWFPWVGEFFSQTHVARAFRVEPELNRRKAA